MYSIFHPFPLSISVASTGVTPSSTFSATTTSAPPVTNSTTAQPTVTYPTATTAPPTTTTAPPTTTTAPPTATTAQPPSGGEQEAVVLYISDMTEAKVREDLTIVEKNSRTKNTAHVFALLFTVLKVNLDCRKIKTNHGNHFSQSEQQNSMHSLHFE